MLVAVVLRSQARIGIKYKNIHIVDRKNSTHLLFFKYSAQHKKVSFLLMFLRRGLYE
jgi:hypothetical protein